MPWLSLTEAQYGVESSSGESRASTDNCSLPEGRHILACRSFPRESSRPPSTEPQASHSMRRPFNRHEAIAHSVRVRKHRRMEMPLHRSTRYLAVIATLALATPRAHAQGFGINEIGSCAASRSFAVTGSPCKDASAIFWNPGATVGGAKGWSFLAGAAAIMIDGSFTQDTTFRKYKGDVPTAIVPHVFVNYQPANSKLSYGLGVYVPYGLTSQWTDSFPGRFLAKKAALSALYIQPNVAYQINSKWSVGGGPVIGRSSIELVQGIDLSSQLAAAG